MTETPLEQLSRAERMLAEVATADQAVELITIGEKARVMAKMAGLGTASVNHATTVKLRAELRLVELHRDGVAAGVYRANHRPSENYSDSEQFPYPAPRLSEARTIAALYDEAAILEQAALASARDRELSRDSLLQIAKRNQARQVDADARAVVHAHADDVVSQRWTMLAGPLEQRGADIADASVDLIVTDPPYPSESLPLWSELAELAARTLKPQGILVALSGRINLPDVVERLAEHLSYGWVYCQPLPGANARILARHVCEAWKPWLAFSNGPWPSGRVDWHIDMLDGVGQSKTRYRWEQASEPAAQLVDNLAPDNGLVLDPFAGTGTYGVAALSTGRRFIGVEADHGRFLGCCERLGCA
jgi:16S rRNA G966 N2-methylase RsmD